MIADFRRETNQR